MSDSKKLLKFWQKVEIVIVIILVAIVWALLSLPIIFFHLPVEEENPVLTNTSLNRSSACSISTQFITIEDVCFLELEHILTDSCLQEMGQDIVVIQKEEDTIGQLNLGLDFIGASEDCRNEVVPFLCQHLFGLCSETGLLIQPTTSQCEKIRTVICPLEWKAALSFGIDLPDCSTLPSELPSCQTTNNKTREETDSDGENQSSSRNKTSIAKMLPCSRGFYRENGSQLCTPSCYTFTVYEETLSVAIDIILGVTAFLGFLAAIVGISASFIRHNRMLTFPSAFIVYMVLDILVLAFFVLVMYMDRRGLFCSSRNLLQSISNVTPFCVISGMMFTYVLGQMALWWVFHTSALFWKVLFPFHSRSYEMSGKIKYIHGVSVLLGILIPFVPIVTSMSKFAVDVREKAGDGTPSSELFLSGGLGFFTSRFPAILCTGSDKDAVFYSLILPIDLILAAGCTLLLIIFWSIHRQSLNVKLNEKNNPFKFGTAEKKLLVVFCYYVVLASVALSAFTLSTRNASISATFLQQYFLCEQRGHDPRRPCVREYHKYTYPSLTTLSYVFLGLFPVVNLIYAININELKEMAQKLKLRKRKTDSYPSTGSTVAMTSTLKRNQ